jgi:hypothetical protein
MNENLRVLPLVKTKMKQAGMSTVRIIKSFDQSNGFIVESKSHPNE